MNEPTQSRRPKGNGWARLAVPAADSADIDTTVWRKGSTAVVSSLSWVELPDGRPGLTFQVSVSRMGRRPKAVDVKRALRAFGMKGAEEDNHSPGVARHFWLICDPLRRRACPCKDEVTIVEPDGYIWQQKGTE